MMLRDVTYRECAINGASPIGLILALFDRLIVDLRHAAAAMHQRDIETRCRELNHALLIVGQLESWVDRQNGGEAADQLVGFYSYARSKMLEASARVAPKLLEDLAAMILHVRSAWQQHDCPGLPDSSPEPRFAARAAQGASAFDESESDATSLSLSV